VYVYNIYPSLMFRKPDGKIVGYPPTKWTQEFVDAIEESYLNESSVYALCRSQKKTGIGVS
jgi:hypothetical protein